ncbi:MAG: hypothetical protein E6614_18660, partial [Bradyrhizobium sp.]|nr:hypothetical protein [Bradyrhizobium sp.]
KKKRRTTTARPRERPGFFWSRGRDPEKRQPLLRKEQARTKRSVHDAAPDAPHDLFGTGAQHHRQRRESRARDPAGSQHFQTNGWFDVEPPAICDRFSSAVAMARASL